MFSGCTHKYVFEGKFTKIKDAGDWWEGIFQDTNSGEIIEIHGDALEYVHTGVLMRVSVEYLSCYRLIFYEYLEDLPTQQEIVYETTIVEMALSKTDQFKIAFVEWFSERFPIRYAIYCWRMQL